MLSGKSNFAISHLEAVANALEVHPKELLDFDSNWLNIRQPEKREKPSNFNLWNY